jgi:hypothetical protein
MTGVEASKLFVAPHGDPLPRGRNVARLYLALHHFRPLEKAFAYSPSAEEWCSAHGQQTRHFRPLEKAFAYSPSAEEWCEESSNKKTQEEKPR